jgi:hypothetical protein
VGLSGCSILTSTPLSPFFTGNGTWITFSTPFTWTNNISRVRMEVYIKSLNGNDVTLTVVTDSPDSYIDINPWFD